MSNPSYHGFTIKGGDSVFALTRPALHGRPRGDLVYIGRIWKNGRAWCNDQCSDFFPTQTEAAKSLYRIVAR